MSLFNNYFYACISLLNSTNVIPDSIGIFVKDSIKRESFE